MTEVKVKKCSSCKNIIDIKCLICGRSVCYECGGELFIEMDDDELVCINRCDADGNSKESY